MVVNGVIWRTGLVGARTDTFPTAAAVIAAIPNAMTGTAFTLIYVNATGIAVTLGAGGMTAGGGTITSVAANTARYFIGRLSGGTPPTVVTLTSMGTLGTP
jgi:hypothetical protein